MAKLMALRAAERGMQADLVAAGKTAPLGARHIASLQKFGNQLQWTGRMIQYNFTLPILAAGVAATKWAMDNETAMTHVAKVYGDTKSAAAQFRAESKNNMTQKQAETKAMETFRGELEALDGAFTAISDHYGVQKSQVLEVAGAWAAAGASGRALADSVNATMKAIIIGDMDATAATKALISIQAQYNLSSAELNATLAKLNSVENQTGASMSDLITGFEKAAGVARSAGVDVNHLAAYMAALVPATGSAASAGNALKTIFSRLMGPTKESSQVLNAMGLEIDSMAWQSATATERLQLMSKEFLGLGASAQNAAASVIASRWQVNKFEVLMKELASDTGYYAKALNSAEHQGQNFKRMQNELNTVLSSDPRKLQRMWVMLQNALSEVIQPMIPFILYLADSLSKLAQAFARLDPETQKLILFALTFLALVGPIVKYMGALTTLFWVFGRALMFALVPFGAIVKLMLAIALPLRKMGTLFMGTIGLISTAVRTGLIGITVLFASSFQLLLKIVATGLAAQLRVWATWYTVMLTKFGIFRAKMTLLWIAASLEVSGVWSRMWLILRGITTAGFVTLQARFALMAGLLAIWRTMATAMVLAWRQAWVLIPAISAAGWALLKTQWVVGAITGVGIFGRMRAALVVIWTTTAAASAVAWRTIALGMIAWARLGVAGVITVFLTSIKRLGPLLLRGLAVITGPWGLAIAAIVTLVLAFREQIVQVFKNAADIAGKAGIRLHGVFEAIGDAMFAVFKALPEGVQKSMIAVVEIVRSAALAVYEWFQYINPFAHHSPSLVENVEKGIDQIVAKFGDLSQIKQYTSAAYSEIKRLGNVTSKLGLSAQANERKEDRKALRKSGNDQAIKSYNHLQRLSDKLSKILKVLETRVNKQQALVDKWADKIDQANAAIDRQEKKLAKLNDTLSYYQNLLSDAQNSLDYYASAPLQGMQAMEDQIHANEMAQLQLNWSIMQMEDAYGTLDQINSKLESINGQQEILRGTQSDLRSAGAGSDILSQYDEQIKKLEGQKDGYVDAARALQNLQRQLEYLQREAERLDLVKAMKFDELQYQIDKAANSLREMPFDEIMAGIQQAKRDMVTYGAAVDKAAAAVDAQQAKIDAMTEARDKLQNTMDKEQETLDRLKEKYDSVNDAISAIGDAISDVVEKAKAMNDALEEAKKKKKAGGAGGAGYISPGLANFQAAGNADFPDPGGLGMPPRDDWSSQVDEIDAFTQQIADDTASMFAQINPFKPLMEKAKDFWGRFKDGAANVLPGIGDDLSHLFDGVGFGDKASGIWDSIKESTEGILEFFTDIFKQVAKVGKWAWDLFGDDIIEIWDNIVRTFEDNWPQLQQTLSEFKDLIKPLGEAFVIAWNRAKPILAIFAGAVLLLVKMIMTVVANVVVPLISNLMGLFNNVLQIIKGVIQVIIGLVTGDWKMAFDGLYNIVEGTFGAIWNIIKGVAQIVWGIISGLVEGIFGFFKWLYDKLIGHSIIPDIINGIWEWFKKLIELGGWIWEHVLKPVWNKFKDLWAIVRTEISAWWERIKTIWNTLWALAQWVWENILKPVFNKFGDLWSSVKTELGQWWERIKNVFSDLKGLAKWFKDNVLDKVFNAFTGVWGDIKNWLQENSDILTAPMKKIVNAVISAVNTVIGGVNKISDVLPGDINWHIDTITPLARGGDIPRRKANRGGWTSGARAVIGEGKANYPEAVIPTDPTHRHRALGLLAQTAAKLGVLGPGPDPSMSKKELVMRSSEGFFGVPAYGVGGWLTSAIGDAVDWVKKHGREAVGKVVNPILNSVDSKLHKVWEPPAIPPAYGVDKLRAWVNDTTTQYQNAYDKAEEAVNGTKAAQGALGFAKSQVGKPYIWGGVGPEGYDCSGFMSAITNVMRGKPPHSRVGATASFPWGGFSTAQPFTPKGFIIGSTPNYGGSGVGHMAGTLAGVNVESAGGVGVRIGAGARGYLDGGFSTRAQLMMAKGGVALRRAGGTQATIGESGDEAVIPLPNGWRSGKNLGATNNFYGDLVFPNVTNGDDAEDFINNLESMARD